LLWCEISCDEQCHVVTFTNEATGMTGNLTNRPSNETECVRVSLGGVSLAIKPNSVDGRFHKMARLKWHLIKRCHPHQAVSDSRYWTFYSINDIRL
jgi:hypothetical protein